MVAGAVNPALLGYDLRRGCVNVFAIDFDTLIDKRSRCRPLLHRIVPGPGEDRGDGGARVHFFCAELVGVDGPVHQAERVGSDKSKLARFRHRARNHAAEVLALVSPPIEGLQIRPIDRARSVQKGRVVVFLGQLLECVGIAERSSNDDVVSALHEFFGSRRDLRRILGDVFHKWNLPTQGRFDLRLGFVESLRPPAVILGLEIEKSDFRCGFSVNPSAAQPVAASNETAPNTSASRFNIGSLSLAF